MKSFMANPSNIERKWFVVDAADKTLGRMAAEVAKVLRGKHKPTFTPHMDTGDHVIVINADKVVLTGKKLTQNNRNKLYGCCKEGLVNLLSTVLTHKTHCKNWH